MPPVPPTSARRPAQPTSAQRAGSWQMDISGSAATPVHPTRLWPFWLAWVLFVVYGSLVPLNFQPLTIAVAWQQLLNAPMLQLGVESRADWVANGVLYLPVGFLTTAVLMGIQPGGQRKRVAGLLGLCFGVTLAVAVELAQTAFPPRTVSRNDLLAESIGSAIGAFGALIFALRVRLLLAGYGRGGRLFGRRLALAYALAFPAFALFPFDLLLARAEWQAKLAGSLTGWWLADSSRELGVLKLLAKLATETLVVVPLGALWAAWQGRPVQGGQPPGRVRLPPALPPTLLPALLWGGLLGLLIEVAQLAVASGQSQGVSILTRALGFAGGLVAWRLQATQTAEAVQSRVRQLTSATLPAWLLLMVLLNGTWQGPWLSIDRAWQRLVEDIRWAPLFYHYYTSEVHAVISLVAVGLSYAVLGVLGWGWHARQGVVALMALLLCAAMESAKLFSESTRPDPTNLWIAAAAAWMAQQMLQRLCRRDPATGPTYGS